MLIKKIPVDKQQVKLTKLEVSLKLVPSSYVYVNDLTQTGSGLLTHPETFLSPSCLIIIATVKPRSLVIDKLQVVVYRQLEASRRH